MMIHNREREGRLFLFIDAIYVHHTQKNDDEELLEIWKNSKQLLPVNAPENE